MVQGKLTVQEEGVYEGTFNDAEAKHGQVLVSSSFPRRDLINKEASIQFYLHLKTKRTKIRENRERSEREREKEKEHQTFRANKLPPTMFSKVCAK